MCKCFLCDKPFKKKAGKKFCSSLCNGRYNSKKNRETIKEVQYFDCPECSIKFIKNKNNQKFCSKECNNIHHKKYYIENKKATHFLIFKRDDFKCIYCGKSSIEDSIKLHIDHVYPVDKGGSNDLMNLVTSCEECNTRKSHKYLSKEVLFRIWNRNKELNKILFDESTYTKLVDEFNKIVR